MTNEVNDYYSVGSREDIVLSSSYIKHIEPTEGGSPQTFLAALDESKEKQEETSSLRVGKLIHKWAEDKENFHISEIPKPTEKLGIVSDEIVKWVQGTGEEVNDEMLLAVARRCNYNSKMLDKTLTEKIKKEALTYIEDAIEADKHNKIYMTSIEAEKVEASCNAIQKHHVARELLFMQDNDFTDAKTFKELPVYWTVNVNMGIGIDAVDLKLKALLDDVTINFERKRVILNDLKSTAWGAYNYLNTFKTYKTWRQLAFYQRAVMAWAKQNDVDLTDFRWEYHIIVVETNKTVQCAVWVVPLEWINHGVLKIREACRRLAIHKSTNQWNYSLEEMENGMKLVLPFELD